MQKKSDESYFSMAPGHNNGMHPTANSGALIVNLNGFEVVCAAGDAGRSAAWVENDYS